MTLPLVSFSAAAAVAVSIVHFTDGPLPRNRLIAFTGLVAFAALALLVSALRAGKALVGLWRGRGLVVGNDAGAAAGVKPPAAAAASSVSAPPSQGPRTPPSRPTRDAGSSVTPSLTGIQGVIRTMSTTRELYEGVTVKFATEKEDSRQDEVQVIEDKPRSYQIITSDGKTVQFSHQGDDSARAKALKAFVASTTNFKQKKTLTFMVSEGIFDKMPAQPKASEVCTNLTNKIRFAGLFLHSMGVIPAKRIVVQHPVP